MKQIPMVDLVGQYQKIKPEVDAALAEIMSNASFINGPAVRQFQSNLENYLGVKHVIPCANGTDALQVAMMALDLKPGDEVITTSFTFVATVEVIALLGLTPVLVDVDPSTFNMDPEALEKAITPKTRAVVPVHLFGQCANMEVILNICGTHGLFVIEDNAQALGADCLFNDGLTRKGGTMGHIGCTSFFPSKNLGAYGDGGAIFTHDDLLAGRIRKIANHGTKIKYHHDEVGVNSRLDTLQAAILRIKLKHLDAFAEARRKAADFYDNSFADHPKLEIPARSSFSTHVFHQYTLKLNQVDRDALQAHLKSRGGIPSMVYYPVPLHLQEAYRCESNKEGSLPITETLSKQVISLPMHTELNEEQLQHISRSVLEFVNQ